MDPTTLGKHSAFVVRQVAPFNAGPPLAHLVQSPVTPTELFFVRNHADTPAIAAADYRLTVAGAPASPVQFDLAELQTSFPAVTIAATLQCAGNRREELMAARPILGELGWGLEAISHAHWTGVRLRDVLVRAGIDPGWASDGHVEFAGLDTVERLGRTFNFAGSIPLTKALSSEVLLAYAMNGQPLTPVHGFPLRVVVPGYIGARSVKWLSRLTVQPEPSDNYFQARAYRLFPSHVTAATVDWETGLRLGEMPVTSAICMPLDGERLPAEGFTVRGYALAGGDRQIARVDLSADHGVTWLTATQLGEPGPWGWRLWEAWLKLAPGPHELMAGAVDTAGHTQPGDLAQIWNFKGYLNNARHRISIVVTE